MKRYYMLCANMDTLGRLAEHNITKNAIIASLILPMYCQWCAPETPIEDRNTFTLDDKLRKKYMYTLHITARTLDNALRELQKLHLIAKSKTKGKYYVNPYWAVAGDDTSIMEYRRYCAEHNLFVPNDVEDIGKRPSKQRHVCCMCDLQTVRNYIAFAHEGGSVLCATDVLLLIAMAYRSPIIKCPQAADKYNYASMVGREQHDIARKLGISERTVRASLLKMVDLHLLHKSEGVNGRYMVNPLLLARGAAASIEALQGVVLNADYALFGYMAGGEIRVTTDGICYVTYNAVTGDIIAVEEMMSSGPQRVYAQV